MGRILEPGETVGDRFRVTGVIGRGGVGTTYRAIDSVTGGEVALKELWLWQGHEWKTLELFEREGRVLAALDHPGIPKYVADLSVDTDQGRAFYIAQQVAPGHSLAAWMNGGWRPTEAEVQAIAAQLLGIVDYLQSCTPPVIHRDIKPENVIRDDEGHLFLVDFGAVRDAYRSTAQGSTIVGTFGFMAPEQFHGQALPATDVYGLAATCVALLTGQAPEQLPRKRERPDFRARARVSPGFAAWLDQALAPDPRKRLASARSARVALSKVPHHGRPSALRIGLLSATLVAVMAPVGGYFALRSAKVAQPKRAQPVYTLRGHAAPESKNGRLRFIRQLTGHHGIVSSARFVAGERLIASAASDGAIRLWDAKTGKVARSLPGHSSRIYSVSATADGTRLLTLAMPEVKIWQVDDGKLLATIPARQKAWASVAAGPNDNQAVVGTMAGGIVLMDETGKVLRTFETEGRMDAVTLSHDGKRIAAAGKNRDISVFDIDSGKRVAHFTGHENTIGDLDFSSDDKLLASSSDDKTVKIWSFAPPGPMLARSVEGFRSGAYCVGFMPDGTKLAVGTSQGEVRVVDAYTGETIDSFDSKVVAYTGIAFSKDGHTLLLATGQGGVEVWGWRDPSWRPPAVEAPIARTAPTIPEGAPPEVALTVRARELTWTAERAADVREARKLLEQAIAANDRYAPAHVGLALVEQLQGYRSGIHYDPEALARAQHEIDRALEIDPRLVDAHVRRGYLYMYAKDFPKAHASADSARKQSPNDLEIELLEMEMAGLEEHPDQALLHARRVIEGTKDQRQRFLAYRRLAYIYRGLEEWDSADLSFQAMIHLDPSSAWARGNYADYLVKRGETDRGIEMAKQAIGVRDYGAVHWTLARAYAAKAERIVEQNGDLGEAERWIERARTEHADTAAEHVARGKLALARGDNAKARYEFGLAFQKDPNDPRIAQLMLSVGK